MTTVILLDRLKDFTETATKDLIMPVAWNEETEAAPPPRAPLVFRTNVPELGDELEKAPYILHQIVTRKDVQPAGQFPTAQAVIRTVFCVYNEDGQEGGLALLNLMERLRIALLKQRVIGKQFVLDTEAGVESLVYPDDGEHFTAPYYLGEMFSVWKIKGIERKVSNDEEGHGHIRKDEYDRR
ncbi:MAG: hypothetical protein HFH26_12580 [Clostridiaceae bacterium]|nr:hypothetical protein [Clostridiaceae bacterium]